MESSPDDAGTTSLGTTAPPPAGHGADASAVAGTTRASGARRVGPLLRDGDVTVRLGG